MAKITISSPAGQSAPPAPQIVEKQVFIDRPIFIDREVKIEVIKYIDKPIEIIKEIEKTVQVPFEKIVERIVKETVFIDKPFEVIKEIIKEVPVEIHKIEEKVIEKIVHSIPKWIVGALASETVLLVYLLAHKLMS